MFESQQNDLIVKLLFLFCLYRITYEGHCIKCSSFSYTN